MWLFDIQLRFGLGLGSGLRLGLGFNQWCIAKHGDEYTQKGVAYVYTVYPAYL